MNLVVSGIVWVLVVHVAISSLVGGGDHASYVPLYTVTVLLLNRHATGTLKLSVHRC